MAFVRLVILGMLGLTVVYLLLTILLRDRHRRKLQRRFADHAAVEAGMAEYQRRLRRWLPVVVYAIPMAGAGAFVYWMNND